MTILLLLSICLNIYLFILHKQQAMALKSMQGLNGQSQATISQLKNEIKAGIKLAQHRKANKSVIKKQPQLFG